MVILLANRRQGCLHICVNLQAFEIEEYQSLNLGRLGDGCCSAVSSFPVLALVLLVNGISRLVDAGKAGCRLLSSIITDLRSKFM